MTLSTHISEILRQGVWASITGGWYYEPTYSLFCNTVHVYTWLILFGIPLAIGNFASGSVTAPILAGYASLTILIFGFTKISTSYLHSVFDTTNPVKEEQTVNTDDMRESENQLDAEMVELRDMGFSLTGPERAVEVPPPEPLVATETLDMLLARRYGRNRSRSSRRDTATSIGSSRRVRIDDDSLAIRSVGSSTSIPNKEKSEALSDQPEEEKKKDEHDVSNLNMHVRKMSEPAISTTYRFQVVDSDDEDVAGKRKQIRRVRSNYENRPKEYELMPLTLTEPRLTEVTKSDRTPAKPKRHSSDLNNKVMDSDSDHAAPSAGIPKPNKSRASRQDVIRRKTTEVAGSRPLKGTRRAGSPAVFENTLIRRESSRSTSSSLPTTAWPVVASLSDIERTGTSRQSVNADTTPNIKKEITKFLEELIDKHPETLDAIENVRRSRLGRQSSSSAGPSTSITSHPLQQSPELASERSSSSNTLVTLPANVKNSTNRRSSSSFMDWVPQAPSPSLPSHHIASGHEDTSQGAVHSFQDDDGNWWTYTFDELGVGTAAPLGSGAAVMEMVNKEKEKLMLVSAGAEQSAPKKKTELEVLPESIYDSTDDEKDLADAETVDDEDLMNKPSTSKGHVTKRERALSSSSNESCTYMPTVPSSIFHAPTQTGATRSGPRSQVVITAPTTPASRLRASILRNQLDGLQLSDWPMEQMMIELMERDQEIRRENELQRQRGATNPVINELRLPPLERLLQELDPHSVMGQATRASRYRYYSDLALTEFAQPRREPTIRTNYYYQMKLFPKVQQSMNLKLDRPSVEKLWDRNRTVWSLLADVLLATFVSLLASLVLHADIYYDRTVLLFSVVVAAAQFSLLKSVQPDAASPIHGFNWLVTYSRAIYFCIFAALLLLLHRVAGGEQTKDVVSWNWNPYRIGMASRTQMICAIRDMVAFGLLLHPLAFTMGWFPQVNTLAHHLFEQSEMYIFGGTASFGVCSAVLQLMKSIIAWALLASICHFAYVTSPATAQSPAFSAFMAASVGLSYVLSRVSSNYQLFNIVFDWIYSGISTKLCSNSSTPPADEKKKVEEEDSNQKPTDELPSGLRETVLRRVRNDILFAIFISLVVFALHSSSIFTATQPHLTRILIGLCAVIGIFNHYIYHQLRTHTPWRVVAKPIFRSEEFGQFESPNAAKLMVFEVTHMWLGAIERNVVYPLMVVSLVSEMGWKLPYAWLYGPLIAMRLLRGGYAQPQLLFVPVTFATLACLFDWKTCIPGMENVLPPSMTSWNVLPLCAYVLVVVYPKIVEFYHKISFVMAYVAPWQISWGSAFHAFAQPFSVPHSAFIGFQTFLSSIIGAPLNPFLGSSFFTVSYVRPVKFWERDYNTKRSDASNTRLASQLERGPAQDDSNLNAVFYEHLTRSLQKSLAGDLAMGRWATSVEPGDCFILASFYLNCLVHIVEVGNGFVTFQLRGLEFRGTYCHQREVEAISEDNHEGTGCCCCTPGVIPGMLSFNTAWQLRWLAWEVVSGKYIIDGYSISDNSAVNLLQVHELRRLLVTLYVKCIVYFTMKNQKLVTWMRNDIVNETIRQVRDSEKYVDLDPIFCVTNDEDYDHSEGGISRTSYGAMYSSWVKFCVAKRKEEKSEEEVVDESEAQALCYLLSLVGRRSLGAVSYNRHSNAAESFLYGLHALFKGDLRITCQRDEWVFADMDMLRCVIAPAVKMALKLHQDHFANFEEYDNAEELFNQIGEHQEEMFISHEQDPGWRKAILNNTQSLLALRHMYDDGQDDYKIIMLNRMHLNMRVIKLNRECVRAFWAGQQQELIFLRNRNPERGSIQNAKQVLRNMINSSADQPVGYPIYVSPLTTSLIETHSQVDQVFGPSFSVENVGDMTRSLWSRLKSHFETSGSNSAHVCSQQVTSSSAPPPTTGCPGVTVTGQYSAVYHPPQPGDVSRPIPTAAPVPVEEKEEATVSFIKQSIQKEQSIVEMTKDGAARVTVVTRREPASTVTTPLIQPSNMTAPSVQVVEHVPPKRDIMVDTWVQIVDPEQIFKYLNEPLKSTGEPLVTWPDERIRLMSGRSSWMYQPMKGMVGKVVFTWYPNFPEKSRRSHVGDHIHLLAVPAMTMGLVPIAEKGCRTLSLSETAMHIITSTTEHVEFMNRIGEALVNAGLIKSSATASVVPDATLSSKSSTPVTSHRVHSGSQPSTSKEPTGTESS